MRRESFACFDCRVSFKRDDPNESAPCPNCGGVMYRMGWAFKAPAKREIDQWQKVQWLYAEGYRFCHGSYKSSRNVEQSKRFVVQDGQTRQVIDTEQTIERYPDQLADVPTFVERNPRHHFRTGERRPDLVPESGR